MFGHLWEVELTYRYIFAFKFTLRSQQPDIVPIMTLVANLLPVSLTAVTNLPLASLTPVANLPLVSTTLVNWWQNLPPLSLILVANLPPCCWYRWQFCHRCRWYQWCTLTCEYLREFLKKFITVLLGYSGAGGKLIHEKTRSKKSRDTLPLSRFLICHIKIQWQM